MTVRFQSFTSTHKSRDTLFGEAAEFATRVGPDRLIGISHSHEGAVAGATLSSDSPKDKMLEEFPRRPPSLGYRLEPASGCRPPDGGTPTRATLDPPLHRTAAAGRLSATAARA